MLERKASNIAQLQGRLESFQVIKPCSAVMSSEWAQNGLRVSRVHARGYAQCPKHGKDCVVICCNPWLLKTKKPLVDAINRQKCGVMNDCRRNCGMRRS